MSSIRKFIVNLANSLTSSTRKMSRPFTVVVEGNIGSGKTTFLNYFKKYNNVCVYAEPIEMWRNCNGHNLLGNMYEDPEKWGFTFQSYVQLTMLQLHTQQIQQPVKLMERSIYSARYCFVEKLTRDEVIPGASSAVIDEWFQWLTSNTPIHVDLIIYLRTSPEVVYERMMRRNRAEEKCVSLDFLKELHELHENWLYKKTLYTCPAPVVVLNADLDKTCIEEEYNRCESHILNKVALSVKA